MLRRILLFIALPVTLTYAAYSVVGCVNAATAVKDVESVSDPQDDATLSQCRERARIAKSTGAAPDAAYGVYFDCTKEAGLR